MTKILLLSDTHGHLDPVILKRAAEVDQVWHAGDIGQIEVTEQLKKTGMSLRQYMNAWNKTGSRPTKKSK